MKTMQDKNGKLYYEPVAEFIGNLVAMYNRIKDLEYATDEGDIKCYHQINERVAWLEYLREESRDLRYDNDHYDELDNAIEATEYPLNRIHNTDTLMDTIKWIQSHFGVSGLGRAVEGLDDTGLYVFDDTYNTYGNFGYDTVKDIIIDILDNLDFNTKVLVNNNKD